MERLAEVGCESVRAGGRRSLGPAEAVAGDGHGWSVWREDDNGSRFCMRAGLSEGEARQTRARLRAPRAQAALLGRPGRPIAVAPADAKAQSSAGTAVSWMWSHCKRAGVGLAGASAPRRSGCSPAASCSSPRTAARDRSRGSAGRHRRSGGPGHRRWRCETEHCYHGPVRWTAEYRHGPARGRAGWDVHETRRQPVTEPGGEGSRPFLGPRRGTTPR